MRRVPLHFTPLDVISLLLLLVTSVTEAAHGRRARTVVRPRPESSENKYDRSITTFSDDGRLLQVEYGISASNRGETVACLDLEGIVQGGGVCVAAVVGGSPDSNGESAAAEEDGGADAAEDAEETSTSPNSGALVFEESLEKVYRIDDHALLVPTGLSGDGRALASAVRLSCRRMRLSYGEAPAMVEIARAAASMQHELTRTGGARPFGVTATVVGVDPMPYKENWSAKSFSETQDIGGPAISGQPQLYQSEPGGLLERYEFCSAGRGRDRATSKLAEVRRGGFERQQKKPKAKSLSASSTSGFEEELLTDMIQGVANAALESYDAPPLLAGEGNKRDKYRDRRIDLWLIQSCPGKRGGASIRVAKFVAKGEEVSIAAKMLTDS
uniref:Proteasome alpha-type subunits domain-containing protein n=1 Tax=Odontella aurita TaxID=265563 RepID=A0A7S4HHK1_9STRA|mmetsp:Transcript_10067/g.29770  ORF Transcript_10067/g.29770 Transcript_10067/m.29770 type:complete len:385 (+) Transcript_10067:52-1206(+)